MSKDLTEKELEEKFVGKKVIVKNTNEHPDFFVSGSMDCYKQKPFVVKYISYILISPGHRGYVLVVDNPQAAPPGVAHTRASAGHYYLLPSWVEIVEDKPEPEKTACRCNIFVTGCICGVFKAEKAAKGA